MSYHHTRADFRIFHGVRNDIEFIIRDADRRTVALAEGERLTVHITHIENKRVILEKDLTPVMPAKGHYRLALDPLAIVGAPLGIYRYVVTRTAPGGDPVMLYMDRDHGPASIVEITDGPIPVTPEPVRITGEDFYPRDGLHYSGAYPGAAQIGNHTGEHSLLCRFDQFTGEITIQASIEDGIPGSDAEWFDVMAASFDNVTDNRLIAFNGTFTHVRFVTSSVDGLYEIQFKN